MIEVIIRVAAYVILIFINVKLFIEKKKMHNFTFAIFFMSEFIRVIFVDKYVSTTIK
jgi:hypothetical protein